MHARGFDVVLEADARSLTRQLLPQRTPTHLQPMIWDARNDRKGEYSIGG
jgi:hypothetical protein